MVTLVKNSEELNQLSENYFNSDIAKRKIEKAKKAYALVRDELKQRKAKS